MLIIDSSEPCVQCGVSANEEQIEFIHATGEPFVCISCQRKQMSHLFPEFETFLQDIYIQIRREELRNDPPQKESAKYIVEWSGGKDSTAMLLAMLTGENPLGKKYQIDYILFSDTGFEFEQMIQYLNKMQRYLEFPITVVGSEKSFDEWFWGKPKRGKGKGIHRGLPLVTVGCYWMRESKAKPFQKLTKGNYVYIGMAADEPHRAKPYDYQLETFYPLIEWGWTEKDCRQYLEKKNLLNPLYDDVSRTGCWFCPKQNVNSLYYLWKNHPEKWLELKEMVRNSPYGFKPGVTSLDGYDLKFQNREKQKDLKEFQKRKKGDD